MIQLGVVQAVKDLAADGADGGASGSGGGDGREAGTPATNWAPSWATCTSSWPRAAGPHPSIPFNLTVTNIVHYGCTRAHSHPCRASSKYLYLLAFTPLSLKPLQYSRLLHQRYSYVR